jgi:hypothetical protein
VLLLQLYPVKLLVGINNVSLPLIKMSAVLLALTEKFPPTSLDISGCDYRTWSGVASI